MKRLVGGDYQLDLSPIEIEESVDGETYTSITDKSVLDQLTGLKTFIGKSGMIKPIWIKLLNGETDEIMVTRGSLSTSDGTTFLIKVLLVGFILTLSVEFTQAETEDHTPLDEWYIDDNDAMYILISDTQDLAGKLADFEGDVSITGDLSVTGKINNETNPSVKPIYYHPCYLRADDGEATPSEVRISCAIFNNDATPFTSTTFIQYLKDLMDEGALINTDGYVQVGASYCTLVIMRKTGSNYLLLYFTDSTSMNSTSLDTYIQHVTEFVDGVNKIN